MDRGHDESQQNEPWRTAWPEAELEAVPLCPVCGSGRRTLLYSGLVDNVFRVAPGRWNLHRCGDCKSAYLDPRPNQASIGKAYSSYYTHESATTPQTAHEALSPLRKLRRVVSNSYLNHRFGTQRHPASVLGLLAARALPMQRRTLDSEFRHLPKPTAGQKLLDVGCGNGDFLAKAEAAGWNALGIDLDPKAVEAATRLNLNAKVGAVSALTNETARFHAITLSHIIEHVHDPGQLLRDVFRLLVPGGLVYIETPNIESNGARHFQQHWRGLEAPRHLALFNRDSLASLLHVAGFERAQFTTRQNVTDGIFSQSINLRHGRPPLTHSDEGNLLRAYWRCRSAVSPNRNEFLTLLARRPR